MNEKQTSAKYTLEFKQEAARQVKAGRAASAVATTLGMPKAGLTNWVRADAKGQSAVEPQGKAAVPAITPEQAEIARLRAQVARLTMERDIAIFALGRPVPIADLLPMWITLGGCFRPSSTLTECACCWSTSAYASGQISPPPPQQTLAALAHLRFRIA